MKNTLRKKMIMRSPRHAISASVIAFISMLLPLEAQSPQPLEFQSRMEAPRPGSESRSAPIPVQPVNAAVIAQAIPIAFQGQPLRIGVMVEKVAVEKVAVEKVEAEGSEECALPCRNPRYVY